MSSDGEKPCAVIDNGTSMLRAGLSGEDHPTCCFENRVRVPRHSPPPFAGAMQTVYVGNEGPSRFMKLIAPMEMGIVTDWDVMEKVWRHTFDNELRIIVGAEAEAEAEDEQADVAGVLLTEAPLNPQGNRERTAEIMFESFNPERFLLANSAVLSLYASGRDTGAVVAFGAEVSHVVPIYRGKSMSHAIQRTKLGGWDLTDYICKILTESKINLHTSAERMSAMKIKEELCYVSMNFAEEVDNFAGKEKQFEMPDMSVVTVHNQIIRCPELLFQPSMNNKEAVGLHQMASRSIDSCDPDMRNDLLSNIVMAGGTALFPGMPERLQRELEGLFRRRDATLVQRCALLAVVCVSMGCLVLDWPVTRRSALIPQREGCAHEFWTKYVLTSRQRTWL
eukprot:TRINITY_DN430_c0_g3_i2.p1 TRINITY_DN430_c0_g3~~TRINITY_DN430_c0_g3_i2.p1  ORF type:complete len:393 (-),score=84.47 TRINITY_DN430_c0_g3_i2:594-1772(-)